MVLLRQRRQPGAVLLLNHTAFAIEGLYFIEPRDAAGNPRVGGLEAILPANMLADHISAAAEIRLPRTVPLVRCRTSKALLPRPFRQFTTSGYLFTYLRIAAPGESCKTETGGKVNKNIEFKCNKHKLIWSYGLGFYKRWTKKGRDAALG